MFSELEVGKKQTNCRCLQQKTADIHFSDAFNGTWSDVLLVVHKQNTQNLTSLAFLAPSSMSNI